MQYLRSLNFPALFTFQVLADKRDCANFKTADDFRCRFCLSSQKARHLNPDLKPKSKIPSQNERSNNLPEKKNGNLNEDNSEDICWGNEISKHSGINKPNSSPKLPMLIISSMQVKTFFLWLKHSYYSNINF